ncbi:hypothetical protein [Halomonas tibetensis]|uniref:Uncharacterized protein n=1 Tax=Halomonas tibetensis TaxID=2259590 RepID=A0ABV7B7Z0_9GAMM
MSAFNRVAWPALRPRGRSGTAAQPPSRNAFHAADTVGAESLVRAAVSATV